jgi:16S rRNA (guanine(966)-N(2))-methyltransferase RsmD
MLRIIGGKYRHLQIKAPNVETTRPTTDKVREALMSILLNEIPGARVLDLFAGSGALGLESLSRGAISCDFVDNNINAINTIKDNIKYMKIEEEVHIYKENYLTFLKNKSSCQYDVIFLDPPYKMKDAYEEIVDFILEHDMLASNGVIIKECDKEFEKDSRFIKQKSYRYGIIFLNIYWKE